MGLFILETNGADRMDAPGTAYLEELSSAPTDAFTKHAPGHPELSELSKLQSVLKI